MNAPALPSQLQSAVKLGPKIVFLGKMLAPLNSRGSIARHLQFLYDRRSSRSFQIKISSVSFEHTTHTTVVVCGEVVKGGERHDDAH